MFSRVLLAVTVPPALPSFECIEVLLFSLPGIQSDETDQEAAASTCLTIAQTKPLSSRAIAVVTILADLPERESLR